MEDTEKFNDETQQNVAEPTTDIAPAPESTVAANEEPLQTAEPQAITPAPAVKISEVDETDINVTPKPIAKKMYADHFSVILNKLAIFAMVVSIVVMIGKVVAFFAAGIGIFLLIMFLICITGCTLGIALLSPTVQRWWGYIQHFDQVTDQINQVFAYLYGLLPYIAGVGIVCAIISIIGFSTNKTFAHPVRRVMAIISIVVLGLACVFGLRAGGAVWTN